MLNQHLAAFVAAHALGTGLAASTKRLRVDFQKVIEYNVLKSIIRLEIKKNRKKERILNNNNKKKLLILSAKLKTQGWLSKMLGRTTLR